MEEAKTGADELKDNGAEEAGYALCEAKQRSMAAAGGGKIKFRGGVDGGREGETLWKRHGDCGEKRSRGLEAEHGEGGSRTQPQ